MKKILWTLIILISSIINVFSFERDDIKTFTLENGLRLHVLEDAMAAPVRLELVLDAGFLNQDEKNGGFFEIYAQVLGLEIEGDCARTTRIIAPGDLENTFMEFTHFFKTLTLTDRELKNLLQEKKSSITDFSDSVAGFINSAMDAKVFYDSPWSQLSGINPQSFSMISTTQARSIINDLAASYYIPSKAQLYISGNISESAVLELAQKHFGKIPSQKKDSSFSKKRLFQQENAQKKFVILDDELSDELTQIALVYTDFSPAQADLLSWTMDQNNSEFKRLLCRQKNLAIRSPEYINVSSAQTKNSSRVMVQAILEKAKVSPAVQATLFMDTSRIPERFNQTDLENQISNYKAYFEELCDDSTQIMEALAKWDSTCPQYNFFDRIETLKNINSTELEIKYLEQNPYVFVLVNSKVWNRHNKEFSKAGFTPITRKNGAWFNQDRYKAFLKQKTAAPEKDATISELMAASNKFIEENQKQFSSFQLKNGIPVTIKHNPSARTSAICLTIDGGELLFAKEAPGLCSVLTNCLAANIRWQLDSKISQGLLATTTNIFAKTTADHSLITITCNSDQTETALRCALEAIIFSDISPALADGITYDLRTQWRIQTGNPEFQLLCEAVRSMYSKPYANLFSDTKDKPVQLEFTQIAAAYTLFLDSTRFSLVINGGTSGSQDLESILNETFGLLNTNTETASIEEKVKKLPVPQKTKKVQLRHQFFTDVSADKAGPRPAVLIPTTDFSDPLLYVFSGPDISSTDSALFNALLYELCDRLQKKVSQEQIVKVSVPDDELPFAQIKITKIKHTAQTDRLYAQTVEELIQELENLVSAKDENIIDTEKDRLLATMENRWIMNTLADTSSARGTAELIQYGCRHKKANLYLEQYKAITQAQASDYYVLAMAYLDKIPALRIYSADSKK